MRRKIGFVIILIGLSVVGYYGYDWWEQRQAIQDMSHEELNEYLGYDDIYETGIDLKNESEETYFFEKGEEVGELNIPAIEKEYPIYWGTDDETLTSGVGMYDSKWTTQPNQSGHVFLAGHRDTVFEEMGELKIGDLVSVEFKGKAYIYQVRKIFVTHKDDRTVIVEKERPLLTLSTCYPFQFLGDALYRYIIQSELIEVK
ncbi:class D sortase [Pseudalkalibacillus decolorationis]|uniref:class D sortase n=1 Tax=Pseudalkalibacillus decolorationis TaxID=163879 RepID=UPI0021493B49|nr:class D sortase [Pseudalkalibacillus decolorationis]